MAPPRVEPILVQDGKPVLDEHGNVRGDVCSPFVDVPTAQWSGNSTGESFCSIAGYEKPFDAEKLKRLYPTHAKYVTAVEANVERLIAARFVTPEDGAKLIAQANKAKVPR